jgi:hypothetical protein
MNLKTIGKLFGLGVALALLALAVGNLGQFGLAQGTGVEDFETCNFSRLPWQTGGNASWFVTSSKAHSGSCAAQAGDISDSGSTYLELRDIVISKSITFWYKVSSERGYDFLRFYIDGQERGKWSGETDWQLAGPFPVTPGTHTLTWEYTKDITISKGDDTAWVDDISFASVESPAVVFMWSSDFAGTEIRVSGHAQAWRQRVFLGIYGGSEVYEWQTCAAINPDFFNTTGPEKYGLMIVLEGFYNINAWFSDPPAYLPPYVEWSDPFTIIYWEFLPIIPIWPDVGEARGLYSAHVGFAACQLGDIAEVRVVYVSWLPEEEEAVKGLLPVVGVRIAQRFELINNFLYADRPIRVGEVRMAVVNEPIALEFLNSHDLPEQLQQQGAQLSAISTGGDVSPGSSFPLPVDISEIIGRGGGEGHAPEIRNICVASAEYHLQCVSGIHYGEKFAIRVDFSDPNGDLSHVELGIIIDGEVEPGPYPYDDCEVTVYGTTKIICDFDVKDEVAGQTDGTLFLGPFILYPRGRDYEMRVNVKLYDKAGNTDYDYIYATAHGK